LYGVEKTMNLKEGLKFIDSIEELSAMPGIALDTMAMLNDPRVSVKEIVDKVMLDQAMVSFILKNCNSPFYGIRTEITSLPRAISLLGYANLKSILMSYFLRNLYHVSGRNEIKERLWKHSIAVAVFSKNIAGRLGVDTEDAYVAGLLHDIGKMVLYLDDSEKYQNIIQAVESGKSDFITAEKEQLNLTHVDTGYFLTEKWKFSQLLKDVVLYHHDLRLFMGSDTIIGVVSFADQLSHVFMEKRYDDLDYFLKLFGLSETDVDNIVETSVKAIESFYSIL
jgi:putative nucleotidyltransferase with HDIG domain